MNRSECAAEGCRGEELRWVKAGAGNGLRRELSHAARECTAGYGGQAKGKPDAATSDRSADNAAGNISSQVTRVARDDVGRYRDDTAGDAPDNSTQCCCHEVEEQARRISDIHRVVS